MMDPTPPLLPALLLACTVARPQPPEAPPVPGQAPGSTIGTRFDPPEGFVRVQVQPGSFAHFLRNLPLEPPHTPVLLHSGAPKHRQDVHAAVVDISTGTRDLQQCADAIMRLRAEHLFANGRQDEIAFRLTNGSLAEWSRWRRGERIRVSGNTCTWSGGAPRDSSHAQLMRYLEVVFTYAGTLSLRKELVPAAGTPLHAGDVFIQGGSPGHAVIVLDVAKHPDGRVRFLLAQSYMPAQDLHVLKDPAGGVWYELNEGTELRTPEWTFLWSDRRRWPVP